MVYCQKLHWYTNDTTKHTENEKETWHNREKQPIHHFFLLCEHQWKWQTVPQTQRKYKANNKRRKKSKSNTILLNSWSKSIQFIFLCLSKNHTFFSSYKSVESISFQVICIVGVFCDRPKTKESNEQKHKDKNWIPIN